jgi:hypothetical protein
MPTRNNIAKLSKTKFVAGIQCPKRLYFMCYRKDLAPPILPAQQAIFDTGTEVGRLARQLFPDGVLIDDDALHHSDAVAKTQKLIGQREVSAIFEAGFATGNVLIRADILEHRSARHWRLLEVKSSTKVKEENFYDVALQSHVLKQSGITVDSECLVHINNAYVYNGKRLDLSKFFTIEDISQQIEDLAPSIPKLIREQQKVLSSDSEPDIGPGKHCFSPYECEFYDHCRASKPEHWVCDLPRIRADILTQLAEDGIEDIRKVPGDFPLSDLQQRICRCVKSGKPFFGRGLRADLEVLETPVYFLDFETVMPAIPLYAGTHPYEAVPFQWSLHKLDRNGRLSHHEFLFGGEEDPREELLTALIDAIGDRGSIVMYTPYEKRILNDLAGTFPEHADAIESVVGRLFDLCAVVRDHVYHPDFGCSFSLKDVQPVLVPEMGSYEDLAVQDGMQAGISFLRMVSPGTPADEARRIREDLLEYCGRDTLGTVNLYQNLLAATSGA